MAAYPNAIPRQIAKEMQLYAKPVHLIALHPGGLSSAPLYPVFYKKKDLIIETRVFPCTKVPGCSKPRRSARIKTVFQKPEEGKCLYFFQTLPQPEGQTRASLFVWKRKIHNSRNINSGPSFMLFFFMYKLCNIIVFTMINIISGP